MAKTIIKDYNVDFFKIQIDHNASKILNLDKTFFDRIINRFKKILNDKRKELILDQFIDWPNKSKTKVINRSGRFKRSIKLSTNKVGNQIVFKADYDPRYQAVQPIDNRPVVIIKAGPKRLAIPNEEIDDLIDQQTGIYRFQGIPLTDPRHPFGIESKKLRKRKNVLIARSGSNRGRIFYFLKRSVRIITKRPIYVADLKLLKMNKKLLQEAFEIEFKETFLK